MSIIQDITDIEFLNNLDNVAFDLLFSKEKGH